jgi:hypothetical protein
MVKSWWTTFSRHLGMTRFDKNGSTVYQNDPSEEFDLEDSSLQDDETSLFSVLYCDGMMRVAELVASKDLQNRDAVILLIYLAAADWRTGRCRLHIDKVAEVLGHKIATLWPSVKRLQRANLLVPIRDPKTCEKLHIVSPLLLKAGSGRARGFLLKTYYDAINKNQPDIPQPDGDDLEDTGYFDEV